MQYHSSTKSAYYCEIVYFRGDLIPRINFNLYSNNYLNIDPIHCMLVFVLNVFASVEIRDFLSRISTLANTFKTYCPRKCLSTELNDFTVLYFVKQ